METLMHNRETRLVALALVGVVSACGSSSRKFAQEAAGGVAGQAGGGTEAAAGSPVETAGSAAGGDTTSGGRRGSGGRSGDAGSAGAAQGGGGPDVTNGGQAGTTQLTGGAGAAHVELAGSGGVGGSAANGGATANAGVGAVGSPAGAGGADEEGAPSCTDGERECASQTTARFCEDGSWTQERCPDVPTGYEITCTGDGVCGRACASGTTECAGGCVEVDSDSSHCGACEHDCGGGECAGGQCHATTIASGEDGAYSMALSPDGNAVFWLTPAAAKRCPARGCSPNPVIIAEEPNSSTRPYVIVATANNVFWSTTTTRLAVCPAAGCDFETVTPADPGDNIRELLRGPDGLAYVVRHYSLERCYVNYCETASAGCVTGDSLQSAAMTDTRIFHLDTTDPFGLYECQDDVRTRLADIRGGNVVRFSGEYAYVASTTGGVYRCHQDGCAGTAEDVATGEDGLSSLAVDDTGVYWTVRGSDSAPTGALRTAPLDGSEPAHTVVDELSQPTSVQVSGGFVYWVEQGLIGVTDSGRVARIRI
jgi:hypothetical protein